MAHRLQAVIAGMAMHTILHGNDLRRRFLLKSVQEF
jgi:hypothetical protein